MKGCGLTKQALILPEMEDIFDMATNQLWHNNDNSIDWFLANLILADLHYVCKVYK